MWSRTSTGRRWIATLGLYRLYWFYRHWRQLRRVGGEDVWPVARALVAGIFRYSFFMRVSEEAEAQGAPNLFSPLLLVITYFVAMSCSQLGGPPWLVIGATLFPLFPLFPLVLAQSIVNGLPQVQALPRPDRNERLSKKHWGGGAVVALLCVVYLLPAPVSPSTDHVSIPALAEEMNRSAGLENIALDRGIPLRYTIGDNRGARVALMELSSRAQCGAAPQ